MSVLRLSDPLAAAILSAAAKAFPQECCGLIEGIEIDGGWEVLVVHEAANLAPDPRRAFLIDPQAQFDLLRALRGSERRILGCFHSHPGGRAEPSATDRAQAMEPDFLYLIAGGSPESGFVLNVYRFDADHKAFSKVDCVG